jgi:hypothetical protein
VDAQLAAEIQVVLEGVPLPASKDELIRYAASQDGQTASILERLPAREYDRLDEVGEELMRPPTPPQPGQKLPRPESGKPPGGDAYLDPAPESGAVRRTAPPANPPQDALEQQTKTQKTQQKKQEEGKSA